MHTAQMPGFLRAILHPKSKDAEMKAPNEVESKLAELQKHHRLAIHCFEDNGGWGEKDLKKLYPTHTMRDLKKNDRAPLPDLLRSGNPALLSMSLLPKVGYSVRPFYSGTVAYLFDLSITENKPPPLVVKCLNNNCVTGYKNFAKYLNFDRKTNIPALDALYGEHDETSFKKAVADDASLSTKQLDAFGKYLKERARALSSKTLGWNEVVAAVTREHIAAIAVYFDSTRHGSWERHIEILRGALAGLAHLKHGMDLPVVLYNIEAPDLGKCAYLAQGKEACTKVAIDAIRELQKENKCGALKELNAECLKLLHVSLYKPIDEQRRGWGRG